MKLLDKIFDNSKIEITEAIANIKNLISDDNNNKECPYCNSKVKTGTKFCGNCGKSLTIETAKNIEKNQTTKIENILNDLNESKMNDLEQKTKETIKYKYPKLDNIKNKKIKEAIENISNLDELNIPFGLNTKDEWLYYDITKMPNLLIGGTVMSGKTNLINFLLLSLLSKYSPEKVRIIIADSKGVDYTCYNEVTHLISPVIRDIDQLQKILNREVIEMKERYTILNQYNLKKISDYNRQDTVKKIPYHIIFIDDYTTFVKDDKCDCECNKYIEDLVRDGWNTGIHLVMVANHPTTKVLSAISLLKFPSRVSFRVPSKKDSKMILEAPGAEKITGIGNALINILSVGKIEKMYTPYVDDEDITSVINDIKDNNKLYNSNPYCSSIEDIPVNYDNIYCEDENVKHENEKLYNEIVDFVIKNQKASASLLQRKFKIGYNKAARMIDMLEERGVIGPATGDSRPREVFVSYEKD